MVVLAGEEQRGSFPGEVRLERGALDLELGGQFRIRRFLDELEGRKQVVDSRFEAAPQLDLAAQVARLAEDLLGAALVVPEPGFAGQRLKL